MEEKILVTKATLPDLSEYMNEISKIWESHWLTNNGVIHEELQRQLEQYLSVPYVTLFTNGHLALENAIQALNLTGEVITTPFTFVSTTHAIARNGLTPVFCDVRRDDFTLDADKIEALITERTSAILPVHVYGNICDVEKIQEIAARHHLKVIYDAAHAFGETKDGVSVASFGDMSMFSFHATKVFNTIEGGCVTSKQDHTVHLNHLKNFGIKNEEEIDEIGGNAKMNEFQAAMGICNLRHLGSAIAQRKEVYLQYKKLLEEVKGIRINPVQAGVQSNYAYFPIIVEDEYGMSRDELFEHLKQHNIFARKYFYPTTNEIDCYKEHANETPIAHDLSRRVLTLPMYPDLQKEQIQKICRLIKEK